VKGGWFPNQTGYDYQFDESSSSSNRSASTSRSSHPNGRKIGGHDTADIFLTAAQLKGGHLKNSVSIDQLLAAQVGDETRFRSLSLSVDGGVGWVKRPVPARSLSAKADNRSPRCTIPASSSIDSSEKKTAPSRFNGRNYRTPEICSISSSIIPNRFNANSASRIRKNR
jgi:hypothetical protein